MFVLNLVSPNFSRYSDTIICYRLSVYFNIFFILGDFLTNCSVLKLFLGFSTADKTWLPVADGYETLNVEHQRNNEKSHLNVYKALAKLRTDNVFRHGRYESVAFNRDVLGFRR